MSFFGETKTLSPVVGDLSTIPVKKAGLGLLNSLMSAQEKCLRSQWGSAELVFDVTGWGFLSNANHLWTLSEEQRDRKKSCDVAYESRRKGLVRNIQGTDNCLLLSSKITGAWMSVCGNTISGIVLSATEFRYFYVLATTSLP